MIKEFCVVFLFGMFLSTILLTAQGDGADSLVTSPRVPGLRAVHGDIGKFFLALDGDFNIDLDLLHPGQNIYAGLRFDLVNTGEDNFCFDHESESCTPLTQYYHLGFLGYVSFFSSKVISEDFPLRVSLLAGAVKADSIAGNRATTGLSNSDTWRVKVGWELQVKVLRWMTCGVGHYGIFGFPEAMTGYIPLKLNVGYARW